VSLFDFFFPKKTSSASIAKERLQIVLAHQRAGGSGRGGPDFLPLLQKELLAVIAKYIPVRDDMVHVTLGKAAGASVLEINVEMPTEQKALNSKMKAATA
jgi:cell division topological specificity factor